MGSVQTGGNALKFENKFALAGVFAICFGLVTAFGGKTAEASDFEITGDAAKGEKVFRKCKACHEVGDGASNKAGPVLNGILGRAAAAGEYEYSDALKEKAEAEELVWTPETLDEFLTKPKAFVKGTKMTFAGIRKDTQRADLIAYLAGFE